MKKNKVKNRRRTLHIIYWLLLAIIVLVFISSFKLSADGVEVGVEIPGKGTHFTYTEYMCAFYRWALNIGFGLTLLMFIYAGYRYMTAAGNDAVFTDTKDILTSAILGFLLLLLIKLILNILDVKMPASCFAEAVSITRNLIT